MIIPHQMLSPEALQGVIEAFVTREGTDYGIQDVSLATKIVQVRQQLDAGTAVLVYDEDRRELHDSAYEPALGRPQTARLWLVNIAGLERNHSLRSGNKALRSGHPLPPDLRLASVRCLPHHDASVGGVTPWSRRQAPLCAWKESTYDPEAPAHAPTPPTHVGRLAAPALL